MPGIYSPNLFNSNISFLCSMRYVLTGERWYPFSGVNCFSLFIYTFLDFTTRSKFFALAIVFCSTSHSSVSFITYSKYFCQAQPHVTRFSRYKAHMKGTFVRLLPLFLTNLRMFWNKPWTTSSILIFGTRNVNSSMVREWFLRNTFAWIHQNHMEMTVLRSRLSECLERSLVKLVLE